MWIKNLKKFNIYAVCVYNHRNTSQETTKKIRMKEKYKSRNEKRNSREFSLEYIKEEKDLYLSSAYMYSSLPVFIYFKISTFILTVVKLFGFSMFLPRSIENIYFISAILIYLLYSLNVFFFAFRLNGMYFI